MRAALRERDGAEPFVIPMGGTAPLGVAGYVNAAFEVADQIGAGERPDFVYVAGGTLGRRPATGGARLPRRFAVRFGLQPVEVLLGLLLQLLQSRLAAKRTAPRARPHPHAVLRHSADFHQPLLQQARQMQRKLLIQPRAMVRIKIRESVMVDPHPPAQPPVGTVRRAQVGNPPRAGLMIDDRV